MIQKCFTQELGAKPRTIRSKSETDFIIEVNNENESKAILTITKINNVDVEITECSNINQSMGLVYIYDYNVPDSDFVKYSEDLKNEFKLVHVQKAFWIETKNITATPLILTYREKEPPKFLNIIVEQSKTKVFDYFERPMMCQDCLDYGHTAKRCQKSTPICAKCNTKGHSKKKCRKNETICQHYEDDHQSFSRKCPRYKLEIEVIKIQTRERVSKSEAKRRLLKENPNRMNYARAVKNPTNSNPIPSTSTRNDQNNPDLNDTSETNQELRREALKIFQETQTNRQSGTVQYYTKEYRYKRPISPSN